MLFEKRLKRHAVRQAATIFLEHQRQYNLIRSAEELERLARRKAEQLYTSGKIFYLLKVSSLGDKTTIEDLCTNAFIRAYVDYRENYPPFNPETFFQEIRHHKGKQET